ncbi:MAG: hypothetical protein KDD35_04125 [Bdellovibrionales bacterium]|nr:hypothetical protein [Bdellovibrionales bacterium]
MKIVREILILGLALICSVAGAQAVLSPQSMQLQELIQQSEEQIKSLHEILKYNKKDSATLDRAGVMLQRLSSGIDQSIEKFQGTESYSKALLELQSKDDFKKTYSDSFEMRESIGLMDSKSDQKALDKDEFKDVVDFQKNSVEANSKDLNRQLVLQKALQSAQPGLIAKMQVEAQLGTWQSNTRVSAQLTELLAAIHAMREEMRAMRMKDGGSDILEMLVNGANIQNQKLNRESRP